MSYAAGGPAPSSTFKPSGLLVHTLRHARKLRRNLEHASIFNARLVRRAITAQAQAKALYDHELRAFQEGNA